MNQYYVVFNTAGEVTGAGAGRVVPQGAVIVDNTHTVSEWANMYIDPVAGGFTPRPVSPNATQSGNVFTIKICPKETRILVVDVISDTVMLDMKTAATTFDDVVFTLALSGEYYLRVESPAPHIMTETRIVV